MGLLLAAGLVHPTTAGWFAIVAAAAVVATKVPMRWMAATVIGAGTVVTVLLVGPMAAALPVMDPEWLAVLAEKDYLFPAGWPPYAWVVNLAYIRSSRSSSGPDNAPASPRQESAASWPAWSCSC